MHGQYCLEIECSAMHHLPLMRWVACDSIVGAGFSGPRWQLYLTSPCSAGAGPLTSILQDVVVQCHPTSRQTSLGIAVAKRVKMLPSLD